MPKATKKKQPPPHDTAAEPAYIGPTALVKVVGVSAAGKSTLTRALRAEGYDARPVSQEHSGAPTLWKQFGVPRALIYLDVSLAAQRARRDDVTWSRENRDNEVARLADARAHADLVIDTSTQSSAEVLAIALAFLRGKRVRKSATALPPLGETGAPVMEP
jgi:hypothetical protein